MNTITSSRRYRTMIIRLAVAVGCLLAARPLTADVVGWWGFEGTPGGQARIGTVFSNRVDASRLPAEVYARYDGAASTDYQPVFSDPIFGPYGMGDTTTSFASRSALKFTNSYADAGRSQGCPVRVLDTDGALDLQTFTLEGWFKMEKTGYSGWRALFSKGYGPNGSGAYAYSFALYVPGTDATNQTFYAYFCTKKEDGGFNSLESKVFRGFDKDNSVAFRDGKWHYVSLVVNGSTHKAHLYFDFNSSGVPQWVGEIDLGTELVYNRDEPLVLGGNNLSSWQYCGEIDEVRLTDAIVNTEAGAIRKRGIPDGTVIGHFHMEDGCQSAVWPDYWPTAEMSAATGGAVPTFVKLEKEKCLCDVNRVRTDNLVDTNCLNLSKGKVLWTKPQLLKDSAAALTVEFFIQAKSAGNSDWASIVRADTVINSTPMLPWNISCYKSASNDVSFRVDTEGYINKSSYAIQIPLDGHWHHVAFTLQNVLVADKKKVDYSVWVDYHEKKHASADGWTTYPGDFHMGFGLAGTPFIGKIDEFRLTKGVLSSDEFLRLKGCGGIAIIVR